jgi:hypothetical protein
MDSSKPLGPESPPSKRNRSAWLAIAAPVALVTLGYWLWSVWGARTLDRTLYAVTLASLRVTPQPNYIQTSVVEDVFRGSQLDKISLLDRNAAASIARAFDMHPWVRHTTRVCKLSNSQIQVDLVYRQPIAMVGLDPSGTESPSSPSAKESSTWFFLPVDDEAVLLPSHKTLQTYRPEDFLLIYAPGLTSSGTLVGEQFRDPRVVDAVRLAKLLFPFRMEWQIESIYVYQQDLGPGAGRYLLEIATVPQQGQQRRIIWGHAPGEEIPGEPVVARKLEMLSSHLKNRDTADPTLNLSQPDPNSGRLLPTAH